ncbi:SPOR domain-containing protein [Arenibacter sp. GZD96]|uniref:SPOR domain-containing protein n=1 Tax=Aurantibrevibacter litoralis TaxID=3106030 RepID=UPI002AFE977F|nr:SPOR domain-containing protein [Arenibacter sp. GZD-96]MEA1784582.1 SPOR domain-containing protein [Arenibacter sp. GZD-96]
MKKTIYSIILLTITSFTMAQEGQIKLEQDPRIETLLAIYKRSVADVSFYRIQVGFGSFDAAQKLKMQVDGDFPGWYSKIDFESPSYRVRLGQFKTKLEAERKLMEVRKKYPQAMLLKPEKTTS